ncbi:hypothetical protein GN244_ATG06151 [Phytophthora infestans]|uniref:Uncharacterized protein n=1 Tax=Phytophthora infestans TaxID=4787 RepID=A0A833TIX6_PHYIN|nr:hypothetical protein GN244_ATG06151 [Phytophthora infestans]KAF4133647.1 hypothetical protein GN958_ATG16984 [Phytophthora infestans]
MDALFEDIDSFVDANYPIDPLESFPFELIDELSMLFPVRSFLAKKQTFSEESWHFDADSNDNRLRTNAKT